MTKVKVAPIGVGSVCSFWTRLERAGESDFAHTRSLDWEPTESTPLNFGFGWCFLARVHADVGFAGLRIPYYAKDECGSMWRGMSPFDSGMGGAAGSTPKPSVSDAIPISRLA